MSGLDVCAEMAGRDAGSEVAMAQCDGNDLQDFTFTGEGTISPTFAPDMCLTVGQETRSGRSDANQIKTLTLQVCAADVAAYQTWATRSE
ncbi:ricin-type beta-trefoil lectin domain protein [Loktanella sp. R86503]|uniref:ricin-type beta-trefoil lectin domain protein n=1 Tax=Loktanella sp. R86503 TaxID=3093847 RepID=UPI0036DD91F8